jgi:feruloyl esterase
MGGRSRPLCPWPGYAHFSGDDPDTAASYECRMP